MQRHIASGTGASFLQSLQLRCAIDEPDLDSAAGQRAIQLINKTNQWSLNGARVTAADVSAYLEAGGHLLTAEVRDAARSYGIVAAALVDGGAQRLQFMVVSCRVIGMGIDEAFANHLLARFGALHVSYEDSGRNRAASAFLTRHADGRAARPGAWLTEVPAPDHVDMTPPMLRAA